MRRKEGTKDIGKNKRNVGYLPFESNPSRLKVLNNDRDQKITRALITGSYTTQVSKNAEK